MTEPEKETGFRVGQKVELNGGLFAIKSIGRKMIVLRALPGTTIRKKQK